MALSSEQLQAISTAERVGASFSLLGCLLIVTTYCSSAKFRRPVSRLIFYASFGNVASAIASLISRDGVSKGNSALCFVQAFFIQYWMPADPLWSFCMAINIYLTFYRRYSGEDLKRMEKWYFLLCYGLPLALATALSCTRTADRGRVYGPALIWCSITEQWAFLRLLCFYGPAWVVSIVTFAIYVAVGSDILSKHKVLRAAKCARPVNGVIKGVRSVTVDVTHATADALAVKPETPNSVCIESQQSQSGSGIDAQIKRNKAIWSYLRYSFLFFLAMVVTWIPSSINRIYSLTNPSEVNFGLNLVGPLVLSLQGAWNAVIYISTTLHAFKSFWTSKVKSRPPPRSPRSVIGQKTCAIPLENMGFDGRSHTGSTSSLAMRSPVEYSTTVPLDV